jgi:hypothetical protein
MLDPKSIQLTPEKQALAQLAEDVAAINRAFRAALGDPVGERFTAADIEALLPALPPKPAQRAGQ